VAAVASGKPVFFIQVKETRDILPLDTAYLPKPNSEKVLNNPATQSQHNSG
jgi:hypothetical protein